MSLPKYIIVIYISNIVILSVLYPYVSRVSTKVWLLVY